MITGPTVRMVISMHLHRFLWCIHGKWRIFCQILTYGNCIYRFDSDSEQRCSNKYEVDVEDTTKPCEIKGSHVALCWRWDHAVAAIYLDTWVTKYLVSARSEWYIWVWCGYKLSIQLVFSLTPLLMLQMQRPPWCCKYHQPSYPWGSKKLLDSPL